MEQQIEKNNRLEVWIAVLIALVSLTAALAAWRTTSLGSKAGDLVYKGLLNAVKRQAATNIHWRQAYQEAGHARDYLIALRGVVLRENSADPATREQATRLRTDLLPAMEAVAGPLGMDPSYLTPEGRLNVQKRFDDLEAQSNLSSLDPLASFSLSDTYYSEQRWLVFGTILIAISLFWLGLSQLTQQRSKTLSLVFGVAIFGIGLIWSLGVEFVFLILRGGAL